MKKKVILKVLIYFIIYSILGFLLETMFAICTKATYESRQSFLYGPFCIVYGIGAICLIFSLNKYRNNNLKLFLYGMLVGATVEYFTSYIGELIMHVKWWDYSNSFFNIHGRTCLFYAICWGILTVPLIKYLNPWIDKKINKIMNKVSLEVLNKVVVGVTLFMAIDGLVSCYALDNFLARVADNHNIKIIGVESNAQSSEFASRMFSDEKIMLTYPNMLVVNENSEIIHLGTVLDDIKNYYYKFGE